MSFVHLSVLYDKTDALFLLLLLPLFAVIRSWAIRFWLVLAGVLALYLGAGVFLEKGPPLYFLPPVLINLFLALLFGRTLLPGKTPLITQYSIMLRGEIDSRVALYTRRVTQLWLGFFIVLAVESTLLTIFAPIEIWSLFANIINYLFVAMLFVGEYTFRRYRLSHVEHPDFLQFITSIASAHVSKTRRP